MAGVQKRPSANSDNEDMAHPFRASSSKRYRLGSRSCRGCHQRKVRCDRGVPCTNCSRCGISCEYPTKDTGLSRKDPTLQDISNRLERLEDLLSHFIETSQVAGGSTAGSGGGGESQTLIELQPGANDNAIETANQHSPNKPSVESTWELLLNDKRALRNPHNSSIESLVREGDKINTTRPTGLKAAPLYLQSDTEVHRTLPVQLDACAPLAAASNVLEFFPDSGLALQLWSVYVKSVDPVLKILHIPTVQSTVVATILDPRSAQYSTVALIFAIFYAAITALCHYDNEPIDLPCEKYELLDLYKVSLDRLLTVPNLMNHPEMAALQALTIYTASTRPEIEHTCLRAHGNGRGVWVLNGLAIRVAQSIDLHRDGAWLQLSPFETEIRLRLWWHLCVLDSRAPEDQGFHTMVDVTNGKLRLPLNVNDNQIYPDMAHLPVESDGWTEMSFFLIQTASCRLLHPILDIQKQQSADPLLSIIEKRNIIKEHSRHLSAKFGGVLSGTGTPTDLSRIALQHIITARKKMEFVLQLREEICLQKRKEEQDDTPPHVLKPSFKLACDGLESSHVLLKEGLASRFKWLFNMHAQWYALAYVLRCLCSGPYGGQADRAWVLVEDLFPRGMNLHSHSTDTSDEYSGSISTCLSLLRYKALMSRQHAQLSVNTVAGPNVGNQSSSGSEPCTSQLPPKTNIPPPSGATAAVLAASTIHEPGQESVVDSNQNFLLPLDLSMPEIPFLPDWNAIINGYINDDGQELNPSDDTTYPSDVAHPWSGVPGM